jgi:YtcA family
MATRTREQLRTRLWPVFVAGSMVASGCDPVVNIAGANFPAWLLCAIVGSLLTAIIRPLLAASGVEDHMGPRPVIYACLALLLSCSVWMVFFNRI